MKPNTLSYSAAITAWANSRHPNAGARAEALIKRMQELNKAGDANVKLDSVSCSSVISAWATSQHPNAGMRGERILRQM